MSQKLFGLGIGGAGIVGVLIAAGIILNITNIQTVIANLAIFAGISIAIVLGILGIVGVAKRTLG